MLSLRWTFCFWSCVLLLSSALISWTLGGCTDDGQPLVVIVWRTEDMFVCINCSYSALAFGDMRQSFTTNALLHLVFLFEAIIEKQARRSFFEKTSAVT